MKGKVYILFFFFLGDKKVGIGEGDRNQQDFLADARIQLPLWIYSAEV